MDTTIFFSTNSLYLERKLSQFKVIQLAFYLSMKEGGKRSLTNISDKTYTMNRKGNILIKGKNSRFISHMVAFQRDEEKYSISYWHDAFWWKISLTFPTGMINCKTKKKKCTQFVKIDTYWQNALFKLLFTVLKINIKKINVSLNDKV